MISNDISAVLMFVFIFVVMPALAGWLLAWWGNRQDK